MSKLNPEDLNRLAAQVRERTRLKAGAGRVRITVHMGTCGISAGAHKVFAALQAAIRDHGTNDVILATSGCAGLCSREPMMTIEMANCAPVKYAGLDEEKARRIFAEHVLAGRVVADDALGTGSEREA